ncbi:alpha-galactosidase 1 [Citrus sinensis]|uniref:Alpha-galactosidase 1 n=1 Tax=Citrus sinensis TaxID=2711 RepID=A0ACB8NAN9_CITSI|nr:alpha-galactosidase 1 [Citrus sinensis]
MMERCYAPCFFLLAVLFIVSSSAADSNGSDRRNLLSNGLGLTPPMGWNSWNHFHCQINEKIIRETADVFVSSGLSNLGYKYVNIDDCWGESSRDSQISLSCSFHMFDSLTQIAAKPLPNQCQGTKHAQGQCQVHLVMKNKMPKTLLHGIESNIAFEQGIDYLKYDNCFNDDTRPTIRYRAMSDALKKAGRPIFFSMCEWGDMRPALWGSNIRNSWRTTDDISDSWARMLTIADMNEVYADHAKPGGWNDPDMLEVGNGGMKYNEYVVHFSIWAISKAPLLLGCDVGNLTAETMPIIGNEEVIAVNQAINDQQIWAGPLSGNRIVVLLESRKTFSSMMTAHWDDIGIKSNNTLFEARDLWEERN